MASHFFVYQVGFLEQRKIAANSTGHGYDKIFGKCLDDKLTAVHVQDAYVSAHHQILNFVRFCELVVSQAPNLRCINLLTGMEAKNNQGAFNELAQSLEKVNVVLKVDFSPSLHDREIRFNNGWIVKIGLSHPFICTVYPKRRVRPSGHGSTACEQSTSSYLLCVSRFIVVFLISSNDPAVTWTAWADSSFRIHCT
ncbi:hypothetical protein Y032_0018g3617 [Ancylostoma ceylanicum]|nr:hypothetical protein Y032_0018g3617 [Ancylostoma ceylanicum]